jgi:hypothetical protein
MAPRIYVSSFKTGETATKKQQMLFATDTAFALSEGYEFIRDSNGDLFQIIDERNLLQMSEEEVLNYPEYPDSLEQEPTVCDFDLNECDCEDCCNCDCYSDCEEVPTELLNQDNIETIDVIIFNTLNQADPIRSSQLDSLIKLAQLKLLLGQYNG